jgi:hypothetical protein
MKTSRQLKIRKEEHDALVALLDHMKRDQWTVNMSYGSPRSEVGALDVNLCGTACCIGGNMFMMMNPVEDDEWRSMGRLDRERYIDSMDDYVSERRPLKRLFYPDHESDKLMKERRIWVDEYGDSDWSKIPPAAVIKAIENFLETGNPKWAAVVDAFAPQSA